MRYIAVNSRMVLWHDHWRHLWIGLAREKLFKYAHKPSHLLESYSALPMINPAVEVEKIIKALNAYRVHLVRRGQPLKAGVVAQCITIVRRLAGQI